MNPDLLDQYQPLIKATAAGLYPTLDYDDAYQQATLFFIEAARAFDPRRTKPAWFPYYLKQRLAWRALNLRHYHYSRVAYPLLPEHDQAAAPIIPHLESLLDLATSLATTTPTQRHCLATLIRHDFDAHAAARELDITPRAVHRIMQRLRTHLAKKTVPGDSR